jgi:para-aminobenzoate synthetase/4-amino-4-deoxychorismate lyase
MQAALAAGRYLAGYCSYELGYLFEARLAAELPPSNGVPLLWFGVFADPPATLSHDALHAFLDTGRAYASPLHFEWDHAAYQQRFQRALDYIRAGDIYQVNLSMRAHFRVTGSARALYRDLRQQANAAHCAFIDDGNRQILSLSPELFFELDAAGNIQCRPMKGTAARGSDAERDADNRSMLVGDAKNRAENLMIVDLIRNDLSRIADTGTVAVPELFALETYPTVHQMISRVTARVAQPVSPERLLRALFPCGSITGAPKLRAMQIIGELEDSPRGVYCGAIGMFAPDGSARFNVAIRTVSVHGTQGELGVGGAIVSDSSADKEYAECLLKASHFALARRPLRLLETLRRSAGILPRGDAHLQRIADSAAQLGLPFDTARARQLLDEQARQPPADATDWRVRLVLQEDGSLDCSATALDPDPPQWRYRIAATRVHSDDALLRHKSDWREDYEREYAQASAAGCDEVLFLNQRDELCEGSRSNLFLLIDDVMYTPPLASGCLPGRLRAALLAEGRCRERVLTLAELARASHVYLGNSLRGLLSAVAIG